MKQFSYTIQGEHGLHARCAANSYKKHKILRRTLALNITREFENLKDTTHAGDPKVEGDETEAANVLENYFKKIFRPYSRVLICLHKKSKQA